MHTFPHAGPDFQRGGIPVENSYFSTFSTSFSTGLFHRAVKKNIQTGVDIN